MRSPGMAASALLGALGFFCVLILFAPNASTFPFSPQVAAPSLFSGSAVEAGPPPATLSRVALTTTQLHLPLLMGPAPARVLLAAAHIDSAVSYEPDEAILLWNVGGSPQPLAGWQLTAGTRRATFPVTTTLTLLPGARIWCAGQAAAFRISFGAEPSCTWDDEPLPNGPSAGPVALTGKLGLVNNGGFIQLVDPAGEVADALLYGDHETPVAGWQGAPAQLYSRGAVPKAGQVWQRKMDAVSGLPMDTDQAADWAGDLADLTWGRRVRFPGWQGWSAADLGVPAAGRADATVMVAVGPEGLYQPIAHALANATASIDLSIYTLEHPELTAILVAAVQRGLRVRVLLEGSPPGGISDLQKWCVAQLAAAGAQVRYVAVRDGAPNGLRTRVQYSHAKYLIVDDHLALNGTDNFNWDSIPVTGTDESREPVGGRRGYYLFTDAPVVVTTLRTIFAADWSDTDFMDTFPFTPEHAKYGGPPAEFELPERPAYAVDAAPFSALSTTTGPAQFRVITSPENSLRPDAGLFALLAQAGAGDEIMVEQLYEHKHWGDSVSNPVADPNPRLEALIGAARRGAQVYVLLDRFFDDGEALRSNQATVTYLNAVAQAEGLALFARMGNPTGGGIHAKLVLIRTGSENWSGVGSLNGSEVSHKLNREVLMLTDAAPVYEALRDVFLWDWAQSPAPN